MPNATHPAAVADAGPADEPLDPRRDVPRIVRAAAIPLVALREQSGRELRDQHRAGVAQPNDDFGVFVDDAILEIRRAPRRAARPSSRRDPSRRTECRAADRDTCPALISASARAASASAWSSMIVTAQRSVGFEALDAVEIDLRELRRRDLLRALMSADSRCAGRNAISSSDVGTAPVHFVDGERGALERRRAALLHQLLHQRARAARDTA